MLRRRLTWIGLAGLMLVFPAGVCLAQRAVGPGDQVSIIVYEHPDLTTSARIGEDGTISFPLLGEVKLGGLSERDAEGTLSRLLREGGFVIDPQVRVTVEEFLSRQISVLGQVARPGKYPVESGDTVVELISVAGGVRESASDRIVLIRREGDSTTKTEIDLVSTLERGDLGKNLTLGDGDVVFVPRMEVFYIYGEVQRPGSYRLERGMMVMQALSVGGSVTERGSDKGITISRRNGDGVLETVKTNLSDPVLPNDVIYVRERRF